MKRALILVAAIALGWLSPSLGNVVKLLPLRLYRVPHLVFSTNLTATCEVISRDSNGVQLVLSATNAIASPIQRFDVYRDGLLIDHVYLPPPTPHGVTITPGATQVASLQAAQPQLRPLRVSWDAYKWPMDASNAVFVLYKSTSLGTVSTPYKPTAIIPGGRTNTIISAFPGTYHFYLTAQCEPYKESDPSNICTISVP